MRASTLYVQNWQLAADAVDYFAVAENSPSPVQHFWSLSVEEQFYLVWPRGAARRRPRGRVRSSSAMAALTALSLALLAASRRRPTRPPPTSSPRPARGSSARAGCWPSRRRGAPGRRRALCWAGLAAIVAGALRVLGRDAVPGLGGAGARARRRGGDPRGRRLAGARGCAPVQFLGDISYSVYLWHWPLIVLAPFALASELTSDTRIAILMLTLLLAWLSKRLIEDPLRAAPSLARPVPTFAAAGAVSLILLLLTGGRVVLRRSPGPRGRAARSQAFVASKPRCFGAAARDPAAAMPEREAAALGRPDAARGAQPQERALLDHRARRPAAGVRVRRRERDAQATIALLGDSHASHWRAALEVRRRQRALARALDHAHQLPAVDGAAQHPGARRARSCVRWRRQVFQWFSAIPRCARSSSPRSPAATVSSPAASRRRSGATSAPGAALPASVERIVVIRDTPKMKRQHRHLHRARDGAQAARRAGVCGAALGRARPRRSGRGGGPAAFGAGRAPST